MNVMKDGIEVQTRSKIARSEIFVADDFIIGAHESIAGDLYFEVLARNTATGKYVSLLTDKDFQKVKEKAEVYKRQLMEKRLRRRGIFCECRGYI